MRAFGRVDILINNAGIAIRKQPETYTLDEWREVLDINLTSAFLCSQAVYPHMIKAGGAERLLTWARCYRSSECLSRALWRQ